jgi:hypothetical protein
MWRLKVTPLTLSVHWFQFTGKVALALSKSV